LLKRELVRRARAALERLPERDHEVLVMRYLERMSGKEVAEVLGISESAVKMRQLRGLERIKALLKDESGTV
jgi:RNA polymerase sigma-70 factor (ECF subfamily)